MNALITESGVSATTGEPFVNIRWDGDESAGQMTPNEARELGLTIIAAAEAAISDASLVSWLRNAIGLETTSAVSVLSEYRVVRGKFDPQT